MNDVRPPFAAVRHTALALMAVLAGAAHAVDSSAGAPLPGLTSDENSNVVVESCSVTLEGAKATVELSVSAAAGQPALLLDGPLFGWAGDSEAYPDRHFPELEVRLDGAPLGLEDRFEAFMGKTDITSAIREAGMDPWAISRTPPITPVRPDSRTLKALERLHAVQRSGDDYLARWTARRLVRIPLTGATSPKPGARQRIALSYLARPAFSQVQSDQLITATREAAYCISSREVNAALHLGSTPRPLRIAEYSIATGIDGHAPPTITLTTLDHAGRPAASHEFLFACGPQGKSIAAAGNLSHRPVQADPAGNLRVLEVTEP